jgi:predicted nucleic acid-binding protein
MGRGFGANAGRSMIVADTSVWIDYFNGVDSPQATMLDNKLLHDTVVMGDLILLEILQGIRDEQQYQQTKQALLALELHEMFNFNMAEQCAENYRTLRKKGLTIRKTADVMIATFCIANHLPLLFSDRDFVPFVEHLHLQSVYTKM